MAKSPSSHTPAERGLLQRDAARSSPAASPTLIAPASTLSGIPLDVSYGSYGADADPVRMPGPGEFPYTRGIHPAMYRSKRWTMRMFAGFGTPEDTNARFHYLLAQGQTGLSTAFDMPTLMGYDPDHPRALGEVGREGVSVASRRDIERLFANIPLAEVTTSMTINAPAIVLYAYYVAAAERAGIAPEQLGGTLQNDMLKEFIAQKEWICPIAPSLRIMRDMLVYATVKMPKWNPISISGYHIREAGATAVEELAFTLASGIAYVELGRSAGLDVDAFAPRLSFFFDVHNDFFEEIAKFRAARRMWARIMAGRFSAKNPRALLLRTHAQTAGVSLVAQQPLNNVVRTAVQALAAILGGTQSLHTNAYDETYALPTEEAAKLALRTQQVLAEETGVANVADPLGGSHFIERLTDEMEARATAYIAEIDNLGGMVAAIEQGYPQKKIAASAYEQQKAIDVGARKIVGVNCYEEEGEREPIPTLKVSDAPERDQIAAITRLRKERSNDRAQAALAAIRAACQSEFMPSDSAMAGNLMPAMLQAADADVTLGEICQVFRDEFGEYRDPGFI